MPFKYILILFLIASTFNSCAQHKKTTTKKKNSKKTNQLKIKDANTAVLGSKADSIVLFSKKYLGVKYKYGGQDAKGFDCAGFVCFVYAHHGIKMPRTADAQALLGTIVTRANLQPGDLVFFKGREIKSKAVGHVGIVVENQAGKIKFISATVSSGIHIDDIDETYWKERYMLAKRILKEHH